jgi:penicillin-binding protein 1C
MNGTIKKQLVRSRRTRRGRGRGPIVIILQLVTVLLLIAIALTFTSAVAATGGAVAYYLDITQDLPDPSQLETHFKQGTSSEFFETTKIYDRTGKVLLYEVIDPRTGDRQWVSLDRIPPDCQHATIALEDKSFYENPGIDLSGIARAFISNIQGRQIQGGSSITVQLIKNTMIDPEERYQKSYTRKAKEAILALEISRRYSKDQILEWYLNTNHYGNLAYGLEAAAQVYFAKHVEQLDLAECTMLAAIPQYPAMNPIDAPQEAKERQALTLDAMVRQGYISADESVAIKYQDLRIAGGVAERFDIQAPHFSIYVRKWLEDRFGPEAVYRGGLRVYTTLDLDLNKEVQRIAARHVNELDDGGHNVNNAAVVVLRPRTGEIMAMLGSVDYWNDEIDGKFNVAVGLRQPGSSFKPFTYITLLSQGYPASTAFLDVRQGFEQPGQAPYVPENYDRKYHGLQRMRLALARSYNIPAVKALQMAGVENVIRTAHKMGITTLNRGLDFYGLALTLGGGEVKVLDMAYSFGVMANGGTMAGTPVVADQLRPGYRALEPVPVLRVEDRSGTLWEYTQPDTQAILDPRLAYIVNNILSDNTARWAAFGHPNPLEIDRPAAAKTGTTNDFRDNWTIGYTPQYVTAVWVGNTDNSEMKNVSGRDGAAPIWHDVMLHLHRDLAVEQFVRPEGLETHAVCAVSGQQPTKYCPTVEELFIPGTEPKGYCTIHQAFLVDRETGKLATVYTPPERVEEKVFEIYPPEAADWVREAEIPQPPAEYDTIYGGAPEVGDVGIISPTAYSAVRGLVEVRGNARGGDFNLFRLAFGKGLNPSEWIQIGPDHGNQVDNNVLEYWDTNGLDGLYSLQLSVMRHDQSVQQFTVQVTADNTPPTVDLNYPMAGEGYELGKDEWINVSAEVADNFGIDRVEFFVDEAEEPFTVRRVAPFHDKWLLDSGGKVGKHVLWVKVYDKAGNVVESKRVPIIVEVKKKEE